LGSTKQEHTMKAHLIQIATQHVNGIARQRAKRALRIRYGMALASRPAADPVWLRAHD
jgi:hypothetical protein